MILILWSAVPRQRFYVAGTIKDIAYCKQVQFEMTCVMKIKLLIRAKRLKDAAYLHREHLELCLVGCGPKAFQDCRCRWAFHLLAKNQHHQVYQMVRLRRKQVSEYDDSTLKNKCFVEEMFDRRQLTFVVDTRHIGRSFPIQSRILWLIIQAFASRNRPQSTRPLKGVFCWEDNGEYAATRRKR
jgi:hypothetical protein